MHLKTKVVAAKATKPGIECTFEGASIPAANTYDRVLVAVGRAPNGGKLDAQKAGVAVSERGFIAVDAQMRTNVPHIFAIGDLVGQPMLAHKATHEAHLAAEVAAGMKREWVARVIPSVAYTDPEIAWVGVTETEAKAKGLAIEMGAEAADIGHTIHPHPTLSESVGMAAEAFEGTITDLYIPKKR